VGTGTREHLLETLLLDIPPHQHTAMLGHG
jgi:hypothetical protein